MGGMDKHRMRFESKCSLVMESASWHCTDCFATIAAVKNKIASFAHYERDVFPYNEPAFIVDRCFSPLPQDGTSRRNLQMHVLHHLLSQLARS